MKTKHTYNIKAFKEGVEVKARKGTDFEVTVEWPETIEGIIAKVGSQRVHKLFTQFIAAHHVQSKIKTAFGAGVEKDFKASEEQQALCDQVKNGETLDGLSFIPDERGTADDATMKKLRAAWESGVLKDAAKYIEVAAKFGETVTEEEFTNGLGIDEMLAIYRTWKSAQKLDLDL